MAFEFRDLYFNICKKNNPFLSYVRKHLFEFHEFCQN